MPRPTASRHRRQPNGTEHALRKTQAKIEPDADEKSAPRSLVPATPDGVSNAQPTPRCWGTDE